MRNFFRSFPQPELPTFGLRSAIPQRCGLERVLRLSQLLLADYLYSMIAREVLWSLHECFVRFCKSFARSERALGVLTHPYLLGHFPIKKQVPHYRGVFLTRNIVGRAQAAAHAVVFKDADLRESNMREKSPNLRVRKPPKLSLSN